jgi:RNA polymerase sigma-70 factor (ECF subfamily)
MQTDAELIDAVRGGDQTAYAELVRRYERAAWSRAWSVLRDYHAAQDATQNAFVEAFQQLRQLRSPEHFGAWLMQITQRQALRIARRAGRTTRLENEVEVEVEAVDASNLRADEWEELVAAVGGLPDQERVVVALRYLEGHCVAEIARLTGRPVGTVTKQLSRAVERLKSILREVNT